MKRNTKNGMALLIAVLVSAIVISIGAAIFSIVQKQTILSSLSRDSQFAFYAADTAAECALYWDSRYAYFAATSSVPTGATCGGNTLTVSWPSNGSYPFMPSFQYQANGLCTYVSIMKCNGTISNPLSASGCTADVVHNPPPIHTAIVAYGYNVPCSATSTSPRVLQRAVRLSY